MASEASIALEQQLAAGRWAASPDCADWLARLSYAATHGLTEYAVGIGQWTQPDFEDAVLTPLRTGPPYYIAAPVVDLLEAALRTFPLDVVPAPPFTPAAFVWFARPLELGAAFEGSDAYRHLRAITWGPLSPDRGVGPVVCPWLAARKRPTGAPAGRVWWPPATTLAQVLERSPLTTGRTTDRVAAALEWLTASTYFLRLVGALWAFLQQEILTAVPHAHDRAARHRLARAGRPDPPLVQVVELRRRSQPHHPEELEAAHWSCQWAVRGHWRQQYYPSLQAHQARWIMPYLKGPEDAPFKPPSTKLFAVVR